MSGQSGGGRVVTDKEHGRYAEEKDPGKEEDETGEEIGGSKKSEAFPDQEHKRWFPPEGVRLRQLKTPDLILD